MSINVDQKWRGGVGGFDVTMVGLTRTWQRRSARARCRRRFVSLIERVRYEIIINVINQVTRPINVLG